MIVLGLGLGAWVRARHEARELAEGRRLAGQVAELVSRARDAEPAAAARFLAEAAGLLEEVPDGRAGAAYATILAERAAVAVSMGGADPDSLAVAGQLLDEAWAVPGADGRLRARIARDRGAVAALAGDLDGARLWYGRADELEPGSPEVRARLRALGPPPGETEPAPQADEPPSRH